MASGGRDVKHTVYEPLGAAAAAIVHDGGGQLIITGHLGTTRADTFARNAVRAFGTKGFNYVIVI